LHGALAEPGISEQGAATASDGYSYEVALEWEQVRAERYS
jgi:hypothetical protein